MSAIDRVVQTWRYLAAERGDDRHAERTAQILLARGADAELVTAGFLHDRAKPADTRLWHRIAAVLVDAFAPALRPRLERGDGTLARYLGHARHSADLARLEGRSDRIVRLISRHHEPPTGEDERLLALADREAMP